VVEFASGLRVEEDLVIGTTSLGSFVVRLFSDRQSPSPRALAGGAVVTQL